MIESMRDKMIAAIHVAAPQLSKATFGGAVWYKVGAGRADRIILQDDRFTASSPASLTILDAAVRTVQQPAVVDDKLCFVSLVTGELTEVPVDVITAMRLMIAPEARETKSVDQAAFTAANSAGLVVALGDKNHVGPTEVGYEALRLMDLLRPRI